MWSFQIFTFHFVGKQNFKRSVERSDEYLKIEIMIKSSPWVLALGTLFLKVDATLGLVLLVTECLSPFFEILCNWFWWRKKTTDSDKEWQKSDRLLQIVTDCYRKWQIVTDSDILLKVCRCNTKGFQFLIKIYSYSKCFIKSHLIGN